MGNLTIGSQNGPTDNSSESSKNNELMSNSFTSQREVSLRDNGNNATPTAHHKAFGPIDHNRFLSNKNNPFR